MAYTLLRPRLGGGGGGGGGGERKHNKTVNGRAYTSTFDLGIKAAEGMIKDFLKAVDRTQAYIRSLIDSLITHFYL